MGAYIALRFRSVPFTPAFLPIPDHVFHSCFTHPAEDYRTSSNFLPPDTLANATLQSTSDVKAAPSTGGDSDIDSNVHRVINNIRESVRAL
jgi:hypothetical protein